MNHAYFIRRHRHPGINVRGLWGTILRLERQLAAVHHRGRRHWPRYMGGKYHRHKFKSALKTWHRLAARYNTACILYRHLTGFWREMPEQCGSA